MYQNFTWHEAVLLFCMVGDKCCQLLLAFSPWTWTWTLILSTGWIREILFVLMSTYLKVKKTDVNNVEKYNPKPRPAVCVSAIGCKYKSLRGTTSSKACLSLAMYYLPQYTRLAVETLESRKQCSIVSVQELDPRNWGEGVTCLSQRSYKEKETRLFRLIHSWQNVEHLGNNSSSQLATYQSRTHTQIVDSIFLVTQKLHNACYQTQRLVAVPPMLCDTATDFGF